MYKTPFCTYLQKKIHGTAKPLNVLYYTVLLAIHRPLQKYKYTCCINIFQLVNNLKYSNRTFK